MGWLSGLAVSLVAFAFFLVLFGNFIRRPRDPKKLVPNCLLTRSPVVFVTGLRSPFYFRHYWNDLPAYLVAHGYDVRVLRLPWGDTRKRERWAEKLLSNQECHLVLNLRTAEDLASALKTLPVRSLFIPRSRRPLSPIGLLIDLPHRLWIRLVQKAEAVSIGELGFGSDEAMKRELLHFIRNEAEREWATALSSKSENALEESSKT